MQQQSLNNEYDALNVCSNTIHYTWATQSAFAYERPVFAYMIISPLIEFKSIKCVRHNSDLAKECLRICLYTYMGDRLGRTLYVEGTPNRVIYRHTDAYTDTHRSVRFISSAFALRTLTNCFTIQDLYYFIHECFELSCVGMCVVGHQTMILSAWNLWLSVY